MGPNSGCEFENESGDGVGECNHKQNRLGKEPDRHDDETDDDDADVRPPLGIELKVQNKNILALRME